MIAVAFVLALSLLRDDGDGFVPSGLMRTVLLVSCVLIWLGVMLSMMLGFTFRGEPYIAGVQGRYILPALPLLLYAMRPNWVKANGDLLHLIFFSMLFLNLSNIAGVYSQIIMCLP